MFISQVIFECEPGNAQKLHSIMQKKLESAKSIGGLIDAECWKKVNGDSAGYTLVTKWNTKENFSMWMAEQHKGGHKKPAGAPEGTARPALHKTGYQFEPVEF